jgi:hypothetical protein
MPAKGNEAAERPRVAQKKAKRENPEDFRTRIRANPTHFGAMNVKRST